MRNSIALALCLFVFSVSPSSSQTVPGPKWHPWLELGGYGSNERSRGEAVVWAPLLQSQKALLFAEIQGKLFEADQREGNAALGYREMLSGGLNVGFWLGYDARTTELGTTFGQVSFGLEALHPLWDFRLNGYVPTNSDRLVSWSTTSVAGPSSSSSPTAQLVGNQILLVSTTQAAATTFTTGLHELAFAGFDSEVGMRLSEFGASSHTRSDVRAYVGGFYFEHKDFDKAIAGPRVRVEWRIHEILEEWTGSRLTIESEYQWDQVRDHQFEVGARLRIPLGEPGPQQHLTLQEQRMSEGVERDTDIVTSAAQTKSTETMISVTQTTEAVEDAATGVDFERAVVVQNGDDLQSALTSAGANSLIIAQGGGADFGRVTVAQDQTLQGGASTIPVRGLTSGAVVDFTAPGARPTVAFAGPATAVTGGSAVVTLTGSNIHLAGFDVTGAGNIHTPNNTGVYGGSNATNVVVEHVQISKVGDIGILFQDNNSNIRIAHNSITSIPGDGINFQFGNSDILVSDNTLDGVGDGIVFQGGNTNVRVVDNRLSNIGDDAIGGMGGNQIEYSRNVFSGTIADNLLDIFATNGNAYTGTDNVLASGLSVGGRLCEASPGPAFTGAIAFTDGTVFVDDTAPCN